MGRLIVLIWLLFFSALPVFAVEQAVVATVGGVPITIFELQRGINRLMPLMVSFHGGVSKEKVQEIQQKALDELITQAYKVCYAKQQNISIDQSEVEDLIATARERVTAEEFERAVAKETLPALKASVYRKLLAEEAELIAVENKLNVTDEKAQAYYRQNKEHYFRPRQFQASHIMIKIDPALLKKQKDALREKAQVLLERARSGEDFYNLAYYHSDDRTKYVGGDLGLFHEGQTVPEFEEALRGLKVDEISGLVKTLYGYHIIKLTQRNEPKQLEYSDVKDKIIDKLQQQQRGERLGTWLAALKESCTLQTDFD